MSINAETTVTLARDVVFQEVAGEIVLLDLKNETYFGLDELGARIFGLMMEGCAVGEVLSTVTKEYEVTEEILVADVEALLAEMNEKQLICLSGPEAERTGQ